MGQERLRTLELRSDLAKEVTVKLLDLQFPTQDLATPQLFNGVLKNNLSLFDSLAQLAKNQDAPRNLVPALNDIFKPHSVSIEMGSRLGLNVGEDNELIMVLTPQALVKNKATLVADCAYLFIAGSLCEPRGLYENADAIPRFKLGESKAGEFEQRESVSLSTVGRIWFESFAGIRGADGKLKISG